MGFASGRTDQSAREASEKCCSPSECVVPHAFSGVIVEVLQQLWEAQHGFECDGQEPQHLHKHGGVQQQRGDDCAQQGKARAEEEVVLKCAPLPEVLHVQIYRGSRTNG